MYNPKNINLKKKNANTYRKTRKTQWSFGEKIL